ncbi:hypothetical protein L7F22_007595 [Adiantum nelumboides]|nr:hypothetical protein [Adiantum nelumboides]
MNRTIMERAQSMSLHADLPPNFWAEAVNTAVYLTNRSPSSALKGNIPEEVWIGKKVNYSFLKVCGCEAFMHIDATLRSKLDAKSKKGFFIGYGEGKLGYRVWDPEDSKIFRSRDTVFNKRHVYKDYVQRIQREKEDEEYVDLEEITRNSDKENVEEEEAQRQQEGEVAEERGEDNGVAAAQGWQGDEKREDWWGSEKN